MITIKFDDKKFFQEMMNVVGYSEGFAEGVEKGKKDFLESIAENSIEIFKEFVDQQARIDPQMYHHIYEWYQEGSPDARLFDLEYSASHGGLTFFGTLKQSSSIKAGSSTPFYNKATIMENGISVTITPKKSKALKFNVGTENVFVSGPVTVDNPGGPLVQGSYQRIFETFFKQHFTQAVLDATGIRRYLSNPRAFKDNLSSAKTMGKAKGVQVGYNWITRAGDLSV